MQLDDLINKLKIASDAYYNSDPIMSDDEYDELIELLKQQDPEHEFLSQVGSAVSGPWPKRKHRTFMGSLNKVNTKVDLLKWSQENYDDQMAPLYCVSEKYDGSTVVATYEKGKFVALTTRGDGIEGEDITPNADKLGVPTEIPDFSGDLRGEAMLRTSLFEQHFRPAGYKNPRNAANGKVRDQKGDDLIRHLDIYWFNVIPTDRDFTTESDKWNFLRSHNLLQRDQWPYFLDENYLWKVYEEYVDGKRAALDYEIDGLVVKIDNLELQESRGLTSGRPKGSIAVKFPSESKITILKEVIWTRGLTGRLGPIGLLEPVGIGGVTVSRVSLCNLDEVNRLGIAVGDQVLVSRRNDVIPKVEKLVAKAEDRIEIKPPENCSICEEELSQDGVWFVCSNLDCQGQTYGDLMNWLKTLKIKGIGPSVLRGLIDEGVTDPFELHRASLETFTKATGSEKTSQKLFDAVQAVKEIDLSTFLTGLNIKSLGKTNGRRLEKKFKELDKVLAAKVEDFEKIEGIKTNAKHIHAGLASNKDLITKLMQVIEIAKPQTGLFTDLTFCITGELSKPRPKVADWIKSLGGEVKSGVSKNLDYLVTNDSNSNSSKTKKAKKYEVKIISEKELAELAEK